MLPQASPTTLPQALATVWGNVGHTLLQSNDGFRLMCATLSSLVIVGSRCVVATHSAQIARGTPDQDRTETAQAQTFFREWGAFVASYGVTKVLASGLTCSSAHSFNLEKTYPDRVSLGQGLCESWALLTGQRQPHEVTQLTGALSSHRPWQPKAEGLTNHVVLDWVTQRVPSLRQAAELLPMAEQRLAAARWWQAYVPTGASSLVGITLSGWCLERLALSKGPQIIQALRSQAVVPTHDKPTQRPSQPLPTPTLLAAPQATFQATMPTMAPNYRLLNPRPGLVIS
jgi:hypothetical protein